MWSKLEDMECLAPDNGKIMAFWDFVYNICVDSCTLRTRINGKSSQAHKIGVYLPLQRNLFLSHL